MGDLIKILLLILDDIYEEEQAAAIEFVVTTSFSVCVRTPNPSFPLGIMQNITAIKGNNVEFRCAVEDLGQYMVAFLKADNPPRLLTYDEMVFRQSDKYELKKLPDEDVWILTVRNVQESDAGGYTCQVNRKLLSENQGNDPENLIQHFSVPPFVSRSSTPSAVEVREGHNVTLNCEATGNPTPTVELIASYSNRKFKVIWRRKDRQVIRYNGANGFGASFYNGSELFIMRVNRKHMSEYVCIASNGIPPDETWTVKLHVTFVEARQGTVVRLVCTVEAWPRPMVTWLFNDVEVYDPTRYHTETAVAERYKSVHVLEIRSVQKNSFGNYRCIASNEYEAAPLVTNSIIQTEGSGVASNDPDSERGVAEPSDNPDDEQTNEIDYNEIDSLVNRRSNHQEAEDKLRDLKVEDPAILDAGSTEELIKGMALHIFAFEVFFENPTNVQWIPTVFLVYFGFLLLR
ncbi:Lachesin [Aphelenchoides besseyi]|nr:Lachesin [Aphelenchoides besseyi]